MQTAWHSLARDPALTAAKWPGGLLPLACHRLHRRAPRQTLLWFLPQAELSFLDC